MKYLTSFLITLSILAFEGAGSYVILSKSAETTNYELAMRLINDNQQLAIASETNPATVLGTVDVPQTEEIINTNDICRPQMVAKIGNINSVVNYLYTSGQDYSFEHRAQIALENGIENYTGTAEQNRKLIDIIALDEICKGQ